MPVELRHWRYFFAVTENGKRLAGGNTKAACCATVIEPTDPPTSRMSRVQLLERTAKLFHLADAGRAFLEEARATLKP